MPDVPVHNGHETALPQPRRVPDSKLQSSSVIEKFVLRSWYAIDGAIVYWRGQRVGNGIGSKIVGVFEVVDEDNRIVGSFEIPLEKLKRREDVTALARDVMDRT